MPGVSFLPLGPRGWEDVGLPCVASDLGTVGVI